MAGDCTSDPISREIPQTAREEKAGKPPVVRGVIQRFPRALEELARVSQFGTEKHKVSISDMSYLDIPDAYGVYTDALGRHLLAEKTEGPINAADGNMLHAAQVAWNALARLEVLLLSRKSG